MRQLGRDHILVAEGFKQVNFNKMIAMNETAAYLWKEIEGKAFTADTLTELLLEQYEIDRETASKDSTRLVEEWLKAGIIED